MKKLYKAIDFTTVDGQTRVICEELIGGSRNWIEPARILGIQPTDFILKLKNEYNAKITPYRRDGKIVFIGYYWDNLIEARKFKNHINKMARDKNYCIEVS